jgi:hypothetical protein
MSNSARRVLLAAVLTAASVAASACASPTAPIADTEEQQQNLACATTAPVNGGCRAGFDLQPWW